MVFISQDASRRHLLSGIHWPQVPIADGLEIDAGVCMFLWTMDSRFSHFQNVENENDFKRRWDESAVNGRARG